MIPVSTICSAFSIFQQRAISFWGDGVEKGRRIPPARNTS
jgi:hypothetical protein